MQRVPIVFRVRYLFYARPAAASPQLMASRALSNHQIMQAGSGVCEPAFQRSRRWSIITEPSRN